MSKSSLQSEFLIDSCTLSEVTQCGDSAQGWVGNVFKSHDVLHDTKENGGAATVRSRRSSTAKPRSRQDMIKMSNSMSFSTGGAETTVGRRNESKSPGEELLSKWEFEEQRKYCDSFYGSILEFTKACLRKNARGITLPAEATTTKPPPAHLTFHHQTVSKSAESATSCLRWFQRLCLAEKMAVLSSPPSISSPVVEVFQHCVQTMERKGGYENVMFFFDTTLKEYIITNRKHPQKRTHLPFLTRKVAVAGKYYDSEYARKLAVAEKRTVLSLVAVLTNCSTSSRVLSFLPQWLDNCIDGEPMFLKDLQMITNYRFMREMPKQFIDGEIDFAFNDCLWDAKLRASRGGMTLLEVADASWYGPGKHTFAEEIANIIEMSLWQAWKMSTIDKRKKTGKNFRKASKYFQRHEETTRSLETVLRWSKLWKDEMDDASRTEVIRKAKLSKIFCIKKGKEDLFAGTYYKLGLGKKAPPTPIQLMNVLVGALSTIFEGSTATPTMFFLPPSHVNTIHSVISAKLAKSFEDFVFIWDSNRLFSADCISPAYAKKNERSGTIQVTHLVTSNESPVESLAVVSDEQGMDGSTAIAKLNKKKTKKKKKKDRERLLKAEHEKEAIVAFMQKLVLSFINIAQRRAKKHQRDINSSATSQDSRLNRTRNHESGTDHEFDKSKIRRKSSVVSDEGSPRQAIQFNPEKRCVDLPLDSSTVVCMHKGTQTEESIGEFHHQDDPEKIAMEDLIVELQEQVKILYLERRDLQAEREVYRYELSSYKEAVSALRASGCVPPSSALMLDSGNSMGGNQSTKISPLRRDSVDSATASLEKQLSEEIEAFATYVRLDAEERLPARMATLKRCKAAVRKLWPRAQVLVYGSFVTGFQLPRSDIDVVICLPKVQKEEMSEASGTLEGRNAIKETWHHELLRSLQECPWVFTETVKCHGKAVPIITLATRPLGGNGLQGKSFSVRLDISFESDNHHGLATNQMMQNLARDLPHLTPLVLVMKEFLSQQGFLTSFTGGLSSYGLALIIARFLQSTVENSHLLSNQSIGGLFLAFLDHLGNRFDPASTGISVHQRCYLDRLHRPESVVPTHGHVARSRYSQSRLNSSDDGRAISESGGLTQHPSRMYGFDPHKFDPLHIQDPLDLSNNVGRNCFRINYILRACANGLSKLLNEGKGSVGTPPAALSMLEKMMTIPPSFKCRSSAIVSNDIGEGDPNSEEHFVLSADHLALHNKSHV